MVMKTASVADLKSHLSGYLRRVEKGEELVVTSHDHPVARIVPFRLPATVLKIAPATRPLSDWGKIKGVKPRKPVDPVALLMEDRARR
jgi:prevent-host-death family protein